MCVKPYLQYANCCYVFKARFKLFGYFKGFGSPVQSLDIFRVVLEGFSAILDDSFMVFLK